MIDAELHSSHSQINVALLKDSERTRTEVWTRVMGYHRPISAFNPGKQSEHAERVHFRENHFS
ncbi:MAG: hypothetical protein KAH77_05365 [Thiomargarita sp.]|nr:hypothetical protein [Thiomargarita sp.]